VLSLVDSAGHGLKSRRGGTELADQFGVEREGFVGKRSGVGSKLWEGNSRKGMLVGWAQQEDALACPFESNVLVRLYSCEVHLRFGQVQSLVCIRCTWSRVRVSRMAEKINN
jgi:hypothetical protein